MNVCSSMAGFSVTLVIQSVSRTIWDPAMGEANMLVVGCWILDNWHICSSVNKKVVSISMQFKMEM